MQKLFFCSAIQTRSAWMAALGSNFLTDAAKRLKVKFAFCFLRLHHTGIFSVSRANPSLT